MPKYTYTAEQTKELVTKYQNDETLENLAQLYQTSVPSVRMKLVKLGVYKPSVKTSAKTTPAKTVVSENASRDLTTKISPTSPAPTTWKNLTERKLHDQWIDKQISQFGEPPW